MSRFTLEKAIERRHGRDPGVAAGLRRAAAGIKDARKGLKRAKQLVDTTYAQSRSGAIGGSRELALVRDRLDEAEMWLNAGVAAIKSQPLLPVETDAEKVERLLAAGAAAEPAVAPSPIPSVTEEELRINVVRVGRRVHVVVTHLITGIAGEAEGESELLVRRAALDDLLAKLEVVGG